MSHVQKVATVKVTAIHGQQGSVVQAGIVMEVRHLTRLLPMVGNVSQAITVLEGLRIQGNVMGASSVMSQALVNPKEIVVQVTTAN